MSLLFSISGNQDTEWHLAATNLIPTMSNFQIVIEGVVGSGYLSDIAVDNFQIRTNEIQCQGLLDKAKEYLPNAPNSQVLILAEF